MRKKRMNSPKILHKEQAKDKDFVRQNIRKIVEKGTGKSIAQLKKEYNQENLFRLALLYISTTETAICKALKIPIAGGCRYKRRLEKRGLLVSSIDNYLCPYTKHKAHLISTNPNAFESLQKSNQLKLF